MNIPERGELGVFTCDSEEYPPVKRGQPALIWGGSQEVFEEPTAFLSDHFVKSGRRTSAGTWKNAAFALSSWFTFVYGMGKADWRDATTDDLIQYRDASQSAISPMTGREYSQGTIANRLSVIIAWYEYAADRGWYSNNIAPRADGVSRVRSASGTDPMLHTWKGRGRSRARTRALVPARQRASKIRPFLPAAMRSFLHAVGPRASERGEDERPARDRLLVDFGWAVGLRLDEIHQLTKYQFLHLDPSDSPTTQYALVVRGKGSHGSGKKERVVAVPGWLIADAIAYIEGERAEVLNASGITGRKESSSLIVSGRHANAPGTPISTRRFQQIVAEGCLRAGLTEIIQRTDPESGDRMQAVVPRHCVHDLRHTYAVYTYWAERRNGNPEPWKKIQAQLGHRFMATTINTYLSFTEVFDDERTTDLRAILGSY